MQVDFLPTKAMTPEELQQQRDLIESMAKATRTIATVVDGQARTIEMFIKRGFKTNGGYMYDLTITYEEKETEHRVIVGKDYYEENKIEPEQVLERVFAFLMRKRVPRHTEGEPVPNWMTGFACWRVLSAQRLTVMSLVAEAQSSRCD